MRFDVDKEGNGPSLVRTHVHSPVLMCAAPADAEPVSSPERKGGKVGSAVAGFEERNANQPSSPERVRQHTDPVPTHIDIDKGETSLMTGQPHVPP